MASARETSSWVKKLFYTDEELTEALPLGKYDFGGHKFCKLCFSKPKNIPEGDRTANTAGKRLIGKCPYVNDKNWASPNFMINHIKSCHRHLVPVKQKQKRAAGQEKKKKKKKCSADQATDADFDVAATDHFVQCFVIADLLPLSASDRRGFKRYHATKNAGVGGRKACTASFDRLEKEAKTSIKQQIQEAKDSGAQFCLSADSWKTEGKRRRHYLALFAQWVYPGFNKQECCVGAIELVAPRTAPEYEAKTLLLMDRAGLKLEDCVAAVTDHDWTIRAAFRKIGLPLVGCGCHLIQTVVRHVIPAMHKKKKKPKVYTGSDSDSSSTSSDSDESDTETEKADNKKAARKRKRDEDAGAQKADVKNPGAKKGRRPVSETDPERFRITNLLEKLFTITRKLSKYFWGKEDKYNALEETAKAKLGWFQTFKQESDTRWNGSMDSLVSHLVNFEAIAVSE